MTTCRVADCGATTDGFVCKACAAELRRALQNHHRGDPDIPTLLSALSQAATGSARVYRANRRPGEPDASSDEATEADYLEAEYWRTSAVPSTLRTRDRRVTLPSTGAMVNMAARDLLDEAWNALTTAVRHLCETRGIEPPELPTGRPASERVIIEVIRNRWRITREPVLAVKAPTQAPRFLADWLADRVNSIRYDEHGPDTHAELTALRERLIRAVDRGPSRVYAGPCDRTTVDAEGRKTTCRRPLHAWINVWAQREYEDADDERTITCDGWRPMTDPEPADKGCGAEHTAEERQEWLFAELEYRLESITWWGYWLPLVMRGKLRLDVPTSVVLSWAEGHPGRAGKPAVPPRLRPRTVTDEGVELFAGGEVMDLMRQYRPRAYAPRARRSA
jgi:hypothetical protein